MSEFDPVDLTDVEPDSLEGTWLKRIAELEAVRQAHVDEIIEIRADNERLRESEQAAMDKTHEVRTALGYALKDNERLRAAEHVLSVLQCEFEEGTWQRRDIDEALKGTSDV